MDEESQGVIAETPASESPAETSQPVESTSQEGTVSEDVQTQSEETGERSVPYNRFKEVNDELKQLREALVQPTAQSAPYEQPEAYGGTGLDPEAETKLVELMGKAVDQRLAGVTQFVREQQATSEIDSMRRQYPDFDQYLGEAAKVLKEDKSLGALQNPLQTAYFIAKGRTSPQAVDAARASGREEAYKSIDSKIASRPGSPVPKKDTGGESDLLRRFKSGGLSENEMKSNWTRLQEELANNA